MPFTPPPYYLPSKTLPKKSRQDNASVSSSNGESSVPRRPSLLRQASSRIQKNKKKKKPGLSINTNVTQPSARPIEQIQVPEQPQESPAWQRPVQNSPTQFPASYLNTSRNDSVRKSEVPQNLYFAPPPGAVRPRSSVYSRSSSRPTSRGELSPRFLFKRKGSKKRESQLTIASPEGPVYGKYPTQGGMLYVDDNRGLDSANTTTSHRSQGWWNVITTPFENNRMSRGMGGSSQPTGNAPAVPAIPPQYAGSSLGVFRNTGLSINSNVSSTLSPGDREVPILFAGSPLGNASSLNAVVHAPVPEEPEHAQYGSFDSNRSGPEQMASPQDLYTGNQKLAPVVVNIHMPSAQMYSQDHTRSGEQSNHLQVPQVTVVHGEQSEEISTDALDEADSGNNSMRRSFHNTITKTVRLITPRSSRAVAPGISSPPANRGRITQSNVFFNAPPKSYPKSPTASSFTLSQEPKKKSLFSFFKRKSVDEEDIEMPYYVGYAKGEDDEEDLTTNDQKKDQKKKEKKQKKKSSKRRMCCICCCIVLAILLALLALIIGLAVGLTHKHQSSVTWLNVTGFPGVPVGELTISRPNLTSQYSGCTVPQSMWSCDVPPEQQQGIKPNDPSQPNMVLSIYYSKPSSPTPTPSPAPPSQQEEAFLGNTTDGNVAPFEGVNTPFFITFQSSQSNATSAKSKRQLAATTTGGIPDIATAIPKPSVNPDGTTLPANLLPFPVDQPLRLFNKGLANEYFGFYTFFDRNIYMKSITPDPNAAPVPADANGGSTQQGANFLCTWSQTRYLVQIWTRMNSTLLSKQDGGRPGTFPYPVTVTLDRHGGVDTIKGSYCWGLQDNGQLNLTYHKFQPENRTANGNIVNPSLGPFASGLNVTTESGGPGGTDGGTGGCHCKWQNF
jgi:hypothetical protein